MLMVSAVLATSCDQLTCDNVDTILKSKNYSDCYGSFEDGSKLESECYSCEESKLRNLLNNFVVETTQLGYTRVLRLISGISLGFIGFYLKLSKHF